jgi:hypothetical protein
LLSDKGCVTGNWLVELFFITNGRYDGVASGSITNVAGADEGKGWKPAFVFFVVK